MLCCYFHPKINSTKLIVFVIKFNSKRNKHNLVFSMKGGELKWEWFVYKTHSLLR